MSEGSLIFASAGPLMPNYEFHGPGCANSELSLGAVHLMALILQRSTNVHRPK